MSRKRILFLAEGATMLHFVRPLALAEGLDPARYEVHFHAPPRYAAHLAGRPFATADLRTMPGERFLANLSKGAPLFPSGELRRYVAEDREIIRQVRPDLVVGDMRLSLPVSARLEQVPYAALVNAYWSPYARYRSLVPEVPLTRWIPPRWLGVPYRLTEPVAYMVHVRPLNTVRREFGLPPLPNDIRRMYTDADHVLYADVPEFVPVTAAPAHHRFIGPCNWELPAAKPDWWAKMESEPKPKVFVSLGSSGPVRVLPALLAALAKLPVAVVLATSGRVEAPAGCDYSAPLLPFSETAAAAKVVVSHGGSGGIYPALSAGACVLGIPSNADQHLSAAALADSGAGLSLRVEEATEARLAEAVSRLLDDPRFPASARQWQRIFSSADSRALFGQFLTDTLADV